MFPVLMVGFVFTGTVIAVAKFLLFGFLLLVLSGCGYGAPAGVMLLRILWVALITSAGVGTAYCIRMWRDEKRDIGATVTQEAEVLVGLGLFVAVFIAVAMVVMSSFATIGLSATTPGYLVSTVLAVVSAAVSGLAVIGTYVRWLFPV
jgi:hypothetical protein